MNSLHAICLQKRVLAYTSIFASFFLIASFTSCLSPRKVDKWIGKHYEGALPAQIKNNKDYVEFNTKGVQKDDAVSVSEVEDRKVIPALLYWNWKISNKSTLHEYVPLSKFSATVLSYAKSKGLQQKLKGNKIEFTVDKMPRQFSVRDDGWLVFLIVYFGKEHVYVNPHEQNLSVSYVIKSGDTEVKKGSIEIQDRNQPISLRIFQGTRKMVYRYLEQYDNNMLVMAKQFVDRLVEDLD